MWRKGSNKESEESMGSKWDQLRQYEDQDDGLNQSGQVEDQQDNRNNREEINMLEAISVKTRMRQMKESSSRTFNSLKSQLSEIYRQTLTKPTSNATEPHPGVNSSPNGNDLPQQNGSGPLHSLGILGVRMKSSTSLQNLEISTKDSLRNVANRTSNMGENMKHKYGSRFEMSRGKYDKLKDEPGSEDDNSEQGGSCGGAIT